LTQQSTSHKEASRKKKGGVGRGALQKIGKGFSFFFFVFLSLSLCFLGGKDAVKSHTTLRNSMIFNKIKPLRCSLIPVETICKLIKPRSLYNLKPLRCKRILNESSSMHS